MADTNIFLPLNINQIFELVSQLPKNKKKQLANLLLQDKDAIATDVPEAQKRHVRKSIKKYKAHPELLVKETDAWKMIDAQ